MDYEIQAAPRAGSSSLNDLPADEEVRTFLSRLAARRAGLPPEEGWEVELRDAESFEVMTPQGSVSFRVGQDDAGNWGVVHLWSAGTYLAVDLQKVRGLHDVDR